MVSYPNVVYHTLWTKHGRYTVFGSPNLVRMNTIFGDPYAVYGIWEIAKYNIPNMEKEPYMVYRTGLTK